MDATHYLSEVQGMSPVMYASTYLKDIDHYRIQHKSWVYIMKDSDVKVLTFLMDYISRFFRDAMDGRYPETATILEEQNNGVWVSNQEITDAILIDRTAITDAINRLVASGILIKVTVPNVMDSVKRRRFYINYPLLNELHSAWAAMSTEYSDFKRKNGKNAGPNETRSKSLGKAIKLFFASIYSDTAKRYPGNRLAVSFIDKVLNQTVEVSSSKKPGVSAEDDGNPEPPAAPTGGQDRTSSLPTTFRRKPVLAQQEKPSPQALDASLEHAIGEVANHWNSKGTLGKAVRRRRGAAADFKYFTTFATAMKTILGGTFFKGRAKVDSKYIRAYSVAEIKRAIDILAEYPDSIRKNVGNIGDFFWWDNPKTNGFNSGTGQSWFLRALFGDDPRQPVVKQDDYPDVTAYLIQKYNETFLRGNSRDFVPREMNHFINAAARAVEVYQKNEDSLACLGKGPEYICSTLVACLREWGKGENGFSASPGHLVSDSLFTKAIDVMTKNGYIRSRATNDKRDEYTPEYDVVSGCVVVPEAPPMTEEEKIQHDNYIKAMKWPVKVRKVMMERYGIPLDTPGIFFEEVMEDADTEQE